MKRFDEALASYDKALALKPDYAEVFNNRGNTLLELKRVDEALASYDKALALKPDYAEAHWNEALLRLLTGDFSRGWAQYEWRWERKEFPSKRPDVNALPWRGEELRGRSILVFSEQGLGDVIQFVRYLPLLLEREANVTFLTSEKLIRLLRPLTAKIAVISAVKQNAIYDFQCALMSLPHQFNTNLSSIPNNVPYLAAGEELVARWKVRIGEHGFKIGIAWQGNPKAPADRGRSIPLAEFIPLSRVPGVRLISLQKHHGLDQLNRLQSDWNIETLGDDFDNGPDAFVDTAAVMEVLDLIITSDTSIAHVAGALGRPTWLALKHVPDWRWMLDREDSPWYPTMRLFRQSAREDWTSAFALIERETSIVSRCASRSSRMSK
jgi:Tetratricopeptide repeat